MRPLRPARATLQVTGPQQPEGRDVIALVLAIGLCTALNIIVIAVLYDAIHNPDQAGISENATQILTGWGGGIVGILGAVFGYKVGQNQERLQHEQPPADTSYDDDGLEDDQP